MIFDSHIYCFPPPDSLAGNATVEDHLAYWQRTYALHHQPAFRVGDRTPGNSRQLLDPRPGDPFRLAADRNFRVDRATNRLVWTADGDDYTKQMLPPNLIEFSAGAAIAEMDYAQVDRALIHVDAMLTRDAAYLAACVKAFPNRLVSMAPIDEWLIPTNPDAAIRQAYEAIEVHGLHALKIIPEYAYRATQSRSFDEPAWRPFWDAVNQLGVPIFFTLGPGRGSTDPRAGFIQELWTLRRWLDRYPQVTASVTHGFPWREFLDGGQFALSDAMWGPFAGSTLSMEVCFPVRVGDRFDFPYRECWPVMEAMVQNIGADRLLWGTDMPFQNRFCTYRQSRAWIENYSASFLSRDDVAKIMGGNATRIFPLLGKAK